MLLWLCPSDPGHCCRAAAPRAPRDRLRAPRAGRRRPVEPVGGARRPQPRPARADARARRRPPDRRVGSHPLVLRRGTRFVPDDRYERASVLQWMFFEQYTHEPAIAVVRFLVAYSGEPEKHVDSIASRRSRATVRARRDRGAPRRGGRSSSARRPRSPTSRSTRTRTSRTRGLRPSRAIRRSEPGSSASRPTRARQRIDA